MGAENELDNRIRDIRARFPVPASTEEIFTELDAAAVPLHPDYQAVAKAFLEREIETTWEGDVPAALGSALGLAAPDDMVCVMGSLFVAAEARRYILGLETDPPSVPAGAGPVNGP